MSLEKNVRYWDVITGKEALDVADLPVYRVGYDSYFTRVDQPAQLIDPLAQGVNRYAAALPVNNIGASLGEGGTPIFKSQTDPDVYIKNEGMNPSGSFKDRESLLAINYAHQEGFKSLAITSSGNAALSAALYSKLYKLPLTCFIPKRTSRQKVELIKLFGAKATELGDNYEQAYEYLLNNLPDKTLNITSGILTLRCDGAKTIAYEIWEQLGFCPDVVVSPVANGSLIAAIYHGFAELKEWGYTDKIPAMVSVQIEGADPINRAVVNGTWIEVLKDVPDSECEAIVAEECYCSPKAVYAIRNSGGIGLSVTDSEVKEGLRYAIDQEGIVPEISSASVFAALLKDKAKIKKLGKKIVLINSATGLKEINHIDSWLNS